METHLTQQRVTLKNLKVAEFASEETLCFTAIVVFDDEPVAEARNDGHGGSTHLRPIEGKRDRLNEAEAFATALPPEVTEYDDPANSSRRLTIDITLDYIVDHLANSLHADRKLQSAFRRDIGNKVLFIKEGRLLFLKKVKLKTITDRPAYFAMLRSKQDKPIVILAELPEAEAFALWKQHVVDDTPS